MGIEVAQHLGDRRVEGNIRANLGSALLASGAYEEARACFEDQLTCAREQADRRGESAALGNLGIISRHLGRIADAIRYYEQAIEIDRVLGDRQSEALDSWNLGVLYERQGDLERAIAFMQVCVDASNFFVRFLFFITTYNCSSMRLSLLYSSSKHRRCTKEANLPPSHFDVV